MVVLRTNFVIIAGVQLFIVALTNSQSSGGLDQDCPESWWLDIEDECRNLQDRNFKVLFGERTDPGQYPYLASLQIPIVGDSGCFLHWCGATFIAPDLVLTAAHCIWGDQSDWRDLKNPGKLNLLAYVAQAPLCKHQQGSGRFRVVRHWLPEQYNPQGAGWDIAILQIDQQTTLTQFISLQAADLSDFLDEQLTIVGWGSSQPGESKFDVVQMKEAELQVISAQECSQTLFKQAGLKGPYDWEEEFCAFSQFTDACGGDSGGPILIKGVDNTQADMQVGVISWGPTKACTDSKIQFPGIYTRIDTKINWIQNVVSQSKQKEFSQPEQEEKDLDESDKNCSLSQAGCECQQSSENFGAYTIIGCSNPDNDPLGNWCLMDASTCKTSPVGISWDYCQEGC